MEGAQSVVQNASKEADSRLLNSPVVKARVRSITKALKGAKKVVIVVRHGARLDHVHYDDPEMLKAERERCGGQEYEFDTPLSTVGKGQALQTGMYIKKILDEMGWSKYLISFWSSPYLRCLQTAAGVAACFKEDNLGSLQVAELLSEYQLAGYYNETCKIEELLVNRIKTLPDFHSFQERYFKDLDFGRTPLVYLASRSEFISSLASSMQSSSAAANEVLSIAIDYPQGGCGCKFPVPLQYANARYKQFFHLLLSFEAASAVASSQSKDLKTAVKPKKVTSSKLGATRPPPPKPGREQAGSMKTSKTSAAGTGKKNEPAHSSSSEPDKIIAVVTHGNCIDSLPFTFYSQDEITQENIRYAQISGINYCCVSIYSETSSPAPSSDGVAFKGERLHGKWVEAEFANAEHIGLGPCEVEKFDADNKEMWESYPLRVPNLKF